MSELLKIEDVAELLNVDDRYVRRLVEERRLCHYKVGKYVRIRRADLDEFLAKSRREATR